MFGLDKLFTKKESTLTIMAPLNGEIIDKSIIPDPTFAEGILGPTIGFNPTAGMIYAPFDGVITQIFRTGHALTITSNTGIEVLIHVGINTVDLKGQGFTALVKEDAEVKQGDPLIKFDIPFIKQQGYSLEIPLVVCNPDSFNKVEFIASGPVKVGDVICKLEK